jgi:hypothetical protein
LTVKLLIYLVDWGQIGGSKLSAIKFDIFPKIISATQMKCAGIDTGRVQISWRPLGNEQAADATRGHERGATWAVTDGAALLSNL